VKSEPTTPNPPGSAGMEVESEGPIEGGGETKVKSWQLKKKMPGCKYDALYPKY
jgi:hypothetical protein